MERTGYLLPGQKKKKSRSLPTYGRGEFIDHKAIFAAFERQDREAKKKQQNNKKKQVTTCLPLPALAGLRSSDRESSLSSDTSCSSLEFIRPDKITPEQFRYNVHPALQEERSSSKSPTQSKESSPSLRFKSWVSIAVSQDGGVSSSPGGTCLKQGGSTSSTTSTKGSSDSFSRKERLDALKARVEAEREKYRGSSSSEDEDQIRPQKRLPRYHSDEALHRSSRDGSSRPARSVGKMGGRTSQDETARESFKRAERMDRNIELIDGKVKNGEIKKPPMGRQGKINSPQLSESRTPNCCFYDHMRSNVLQNSSTDHPHSVGVNGMKDNRSHWLSELNTVGLPQVSSASTRWPDYPNGSFYHQDFHNRSGHPKLDMLTVSTLTSGGGQIQLLPQPSPPDSGVSSQSVASSPSLGRAPTPPPRSSQSSRGVVGVGMQYSTPYEGYKNHIHRPASCALDPLSSSRCGHNSQWLHPMSGTYNEQPPYKRCSVQSTTSSSVSSTREEIQSHFHRAVPPPPGSRIADPLYSYTDMSPPTRKHQSTPVVYSYTDQAPKPRDHHQPSHRPLAGTVRDTQADLKRSDLNFRRLLCNMQRDNKTENLRNNSRFHPPLSQCNSRNPPVHMPPSYRNGGVHPTPVHRIRSDHLYDSRETLSSPTSIRDIYSPDYLSPSETHAFRERTPKYNGPGALQAKRTEIHQEISGNQQKDLANRRIDEMVQQEKEKRCSQKLENALEELETIYRSLKLNEDDDLLDRAERRDLPTEHQLAKFRPFPTRANSSGHVSQPEESASERSTHPLSRSHSDNIQSLLREHVGDASATKACNRRYRRAGVPNKVTDDLAFRRHQRSPIPTAAVKPTSYLLCSSHFTPSLAVKGHLEDIISVNPKADVERDDLMTRKYSQADAAKVSPPHPPFGIPLGPMSQSFSSDYLHAQPDNIPKPIFRPRETPDVVRDDMAFRNLRKDSHRSHDANVPDSNSGRFKMPSVTSRKKNRAARSLSANISQLILECEARDKPLEFERAQSMTDLIAAMEEESCKWQQLDSDQKDFPQQTPRETSANGYKNRVLIVDSLGPYGDTPNEHLTSPDNTLLESQTGLGELDFSRHQMKVKLQQSEVTNSFAPLSHDTWRTVTPAFSPDLRRGNSYSPALSCSSFTSQSPVLPKRNLITSPFWSDSDTRKLKVTPIDEGQLEELLSSLARETQATSPVREVTSGRSGSSREEMPKGELHDVSVLA